uniref:RBR-type E3 ubiquitin transferase n=1 Tax=Ditylenchus dipsaci TaxID=166011 RepID=A0A915EVN2_9BILA
MKLFFGCSSIFGQMECSNSFHSDDCSETDYGADYDFYDTNDGNESGEIMDDSNPSASNADPEYVEYSCLDPAQVEALLTSHVNELIECLPSVVPSLAKLLLHLNQWDVDKIKMHFMVNWERFLIESGVKADKNSSSRSTAAKPLNNNIINTKECLVCFENSRKELVALDCGHSFCEQCWIHHLDTQLQNGMIPALAFGKPDDAIISLDGSRYVPHLVCCTKIECMNTDCRLMCLEDFVQKILSEKSRLRARYNQLVFRDLVNSHPHLRWCPGRGCHIIISAKQTKHIGMKCGQNYHAPACCEVIKKWLTKCADDSETANYISAHTKDCPNCHSCIEKNGGCNHMQCSKCKFHFCWMCFRDWKSHGTQEANHLKARRALEKYLHYYERFENHNKSLKMEEELREKIKTKIEERITRHEGTWIDWQYLHAASHLLTKLPTSPARKRDRGVSWKVERAETTDRGDLENQMHRVEQRRKTL